VFNKRRGRSPCHRPQLIRVVGANLVVFVVGLSRGVLCCKVELCENARRTPMEDDILREQIAYYRARAQTYDEEILGSRFFDASDEEAGHREGELAIAAHILARMGPFDRVLELACGTGIWTRILGKIGREVTAVDAAPEMLEITRRKLGSEHIRFQQADLFHWDPGEEYDLVFFASWLSHVPPAALDLFLDRVRRAVAPGGLLAIVDEYAPTEEDRLVAKGDTYATRPLRDGRTFTIVKVFYDLAFLEDKLNRLGFEVETQRVGDSFFFLLAKSVITAPPL
jgi:ubiquinone/menaquinone biosynthesis C-methylase UbiE